MIRRLVLLAMAFGVLEGCATLGVGKLTEHISSTRSEPVELSGHFHDNRVATATLAWWAVGLDTTRIWKLAGTDLWLTERSKDFRIWFQGGLDTASDRNDPNRRWRRGQGELLEVMFLADEHQTIAGQYLSQQTPRRIWLVGTRTQAGVWKPTKRLYLTANGFGMAGVSMGSRKVFNSKALVRGLYVVSVPLDIVLSPVYLAVGLVGLLALAVSGTSFNHLYI